VAVGERFEMRQPAALRVYMVVFGVVWCGIAAVATVGAAADGSAAVVIPLLMLGFGAALVYRFVRLDVVADDMGCVVRNTFVTKRYGRSEIEDFRVQASIPGAPFGKVIVMLLRDGELIPLDVSKRLWFGDRGRAKLREYVNGLRAWLQQ
jgi:hypothetical protein